MLSPLHSHLHFRRAYQFVTIIILNIFSRISKNFHQERTNDPEKIKFKKLNEIYAETHKINHDYALLDDTKYESNMIFVFVFYF